MSKDEDPYVIAAHARAASTMPEFLRHVVEASDASCMAKLRFRHPDLSEENGEDQFFFLWLSSVYYHPEQSLLSGVFFEVPKGFEKWHAVGSRLGFEKEDVFDWMVIKDGHMYGGFTIRVTRSRIPENKRAEYDSYIGVLTYEPIAELLVKGSKA